MRFSRSVSQSDPEVMRGRRLWPAILAALTIWLTGPVAARVVGVEDGTGAGFLFRKAGNCYVILPTHVHGALREGVRIGSDRSGGAIGTAKIVHVVPNDVDISLGIVRGGIADTCGPDWSALKQRLDTSLRPGRQVILRRPRQSSVEGRRLLIHTSTFLAIRVVPAPEEPADLFGGTSGATLFLDDVPVGMVLKAEDAGVAWALRMDEIAAQLSRFIEGPPASAAPPPGPVQAKGGLSPSDPVEAVSWSAHPVEGATDPAAMIAGQGPWIFPLGPEPVSLTLRLTGTDRLSRIRLRSAEDAAAYVPRRITLVTDSSGDPARPRPNPIPAPEMTPDGVFDLRLGERFAKTVTITIHSSWGKGSPVRLDAVAID